MGFKKSRGFKILKREGTYRSCIYVLRKSKLLPVLNKLFIPCLLYVYPKIALNAKQYQAFLVLKKKFYGNYIGIIVASPIFFVKNLKKHIEWLESDTFKKEYIDTITQKYNIKFENVFDFIKFTPPPQQTINL